MMSHVTAAVPVEAWVGVAMLMVVLGAVLAVGSTRRRDLDEAVGVLDRGARRRDRDRTEPDLGPSGRTVEQAATLVWNERRQNTAANAAAPPALPQRWVPPDREALGVDRRRFFNRSAVALVGLGVSGLAASSLTFLWPQAAGGFGAKIRLGRLTDLLAQVDEGDGFAYFAEGRLWLTRYPPTALREARATYSPGELTGMETGIVALFQKCPHLGCRVPACLSSQWFECPCHGSQYNRVGEYKAGPAPRGLDRFPVTLDGGAVTVDTGEIIVGPPKGTNTTGQEAQGPHCVG